MTAHEMTEPQAFRWIQRAAMDNRTSMRAVAELVLADSRAEKPGPEDAGSTPGRPAE
jgi:response regulator NasT